MNKIGIIGAMPSELADIRAALPDAVLESHAGYDFYTSKIGTKTVVFACCGIAKVNAALCAQVMIDRMGVSAILNTGIAGGMHNDIKVCDIVVSNEVICHDVDPHFLNDYPPYCAIYPADAALIACAEETCDSFGIQHFRGRVVSGDAFISDNTVKQGIIERYAPYAVDMESAAIGQCAFRNQVPFVSVRCISDNADDEGAMSFDAFEKIAAKRVSEIIMAMIAQIK